MVSILESIQLEHHQNSVNSVNYETYLLMQLKILLFLSFFLPSLISTITDPENHKQLPKKSFSKLSKRDRPGHKDRSITPDSDSFIILSEDEVEEESSEDTDSTAADDIVLLRQTEVYDTGIRVIDHLLYNLQQDKVNFENLLTFGNASSPEYTLRFHEIEDSISSHTQQYLVFENEWWLVLDEIADRLGFDKTQLLDLSFHELFLDLQIYQEQIKATILRAEIARSKAEAPHIFFDSAGGENMSED